MRCLNRLGEKSKMRIEKLELFNFRGFERAEVELHPRLTVLVGENGAGKTSVLDALALTLDQYVARLLGSRSSARRLAWSDTREGSAETKVRVTVNRNDQEFRWAVQKQGQRQRVLRPLAAEAPTGPTR